MARLTPASLMMSSKLIRSIVTARPRSWIWAKAQSSMRAPAASVAFIFRCCVRGSVRCGAALGVILIGPFLQRSKFSVPVEFTWFSLVRLGFQGDETVGTRLPYRRNASL